MTALNIKDFMNLKNPCNHFKLFEAVGSRLVYDSSQNNRVFISFAIPTYNRPDLLCEALKSIYSLKKLEEINYEVIVTDNSDNEAYKRRNCELITETKYPFLKYFINDRNIGATGNINRCIELSSGRYVSLLLDDDLLDNQYLLLLLTTLKYFEKNKIKFAGIKTSFKVFKNDEPIPKLTINKEATIIPISKTYSLFAGIGPSSCPTCGILFDRNRILKVGGFYDELGPVGDYVLGYLMMDNQVPFYMIKEETGFYRIFNNQSCELKTQIGFLEGDYFFREFMYSESFKRKVFGFLFRKVQYTISLNKRLEGCKLFGVKTSIDELAFNRYYGRCYIRMVLFKICRRIYQIFRKKGFIVRVDWQGDNE